MTHGLVLWLSVGATPVQPSLRCATDPAAPAYVYGFLTGKPLSHARASSARPSLTKLTEPCLCVSNQTNVVKMELVAIDSSGSGTPARRVWDLRDDGHRVIRPVLDDLTANPPLIKTLLDQKSEMQGFIARPPDNKNHPHPWQTNSSAHALGSRNTVSHSQTRPPGDTEAQSGPRMHFSEKPGNGSLAP